MPDPGTGRHGMWRYDGLLARDDFGVFSLVQATDRLTGQRDHRHLPDQTGVFLEPGTDLGSFPMEQAFEIVTASAPSAADR